MRYILTFILALLPLVSGAQSSKLLEIDASSFAPVQSDALSGVAIDKIGTDPSRRPCARIKMHINRMTREEVEGLSVRTIGGNVVLTKCIVAAQGNGLIIELTAKETTRFYLHHEKYGDSNEVSLNLEGNKEYRIEAMLNTTHSIAVSSNTPGAEIYIDNTFKGVINDAFSLTVSDVYPGVHTITAKSGVLSKEITVNVSSESILFRIDLDHQLAKPQFVMFMVTPPESSLLIDNQPYQLNQYGEIADPLLLGSGSYSYVVSAKDYYEEKGTFVVNGSKVERTVNLKPAHGFLKVAGNDPLQGANVYVDGNLIGTAPCKSGRLSSGSHTVRIIKNMYKESSETVTIRDGETLDYCPSLKADFASVTLKTSAGADIYVDGQKKGNSTWTGDLRSGEHIFEAAMSGHRTSSVYRTISPTPPSQTYDIPAPTPILGSVNVMSSPVSDVYVDDKNVGRTPLSLDLVIGKHRVVFKKDGFQTMEKVVEVKEGQPETVKVTLEKGSSSASSYGSSSPQDLNVAILLANDGNASFELGEYNLAVEAFTKAITIAEGIEGEEAANLVNTCKTAVCAIYLSNAKALIKAGDYDGALAKLNETISVAGKYGAEETVADATALIPNVYMAMGNASLKAKDMAGAIAAYTKVTELNPANGDAYFRLGRALAATGKVEEAVAAYETAAANGEEKDAKKQLSTLFLKKAQASLKAGKSQEVIDYAMKSNEYLESANAYKLAAGAAQKLGKNADCIEYYEKYLALKPNAKDAAGVKFTIAALYQQMGNKEKAIEYYTMVASDPQFGASAQEQLKVLR